MELVKDSLLKAAGLTLVVLLLGVLVGLQMDDHRKNFLEDELRESNIQSESFLVTQTYLEESSQNYCDATDRWIPKLAEKNAQIGRDLQSFTGKSLSNSYSYDYIKQRYYTNQLKLYNVLTNYEERCDQNLTLVFFFFDGSVESQRQGAVLTEYRRKHDNRTYIFSYNVETDDSDVLEILKTDYNVTGGPTIVINGNRTYRRYVPMTELKQVIE